MEIVTPDVRKDKARKVIGRSREGEQDFRGVFGGGNRNVAVAPDLTEIVHPQGRTP